jgi:hypothetical protein
VNVLIGPLKAGVDFFVFEVTRITPARQLPLAAVRNSISKHLTETSRREALANFISAWRRRWRARTICQPGYVVQECSEYATKQSHAPGPLYTFR